jgi:hypothetical protein
MQTRREDVSDMKGKAQHWHTVSTSLCSNCQGSITRSLAASLRQLVEKARTAREPYHTLDLYQSPHMELSDGWGILFLHIIIYLLLKIHFH